MIGTVAVGASVLPVVLGWRKKLSPVWWWLTALAAQNLLLRYLSWQGEPTWYVTWYAYPVTLWLGLRALRTLPGMPQTIWPMWGLFLGVWLMAPLTGDRVADYSVFVAPFHALTLAGMAGIGIVKATEPDVPWQSLAIAVGAFLTYGPFLVVWPLSAYLTTVSPEWVLPVWQARAGLLIVGSLLFAVALW